MCPNCRAFITTDDKICPYCQVEVGPKAAVRLNPAGEGEDGVAAWKLTGPSGCSFYILHTCGNAFFANDPAAGGPGCCKDVSVRAGTDTLGGTPLTNVASPNYMRTLAMVRKSSVLVMIAEAGDPNWVTQSKVIYKLKNHYASRLGARHGKKTIDGTNAYTNFAFFDGHVALFPTQPIDQNSSTNNPAGQPGCAGMTQSSGTVFTLWEDHQ